MSYKISGKMITKTFFLIALIQFFFVNCYANTNNSDYLIKINDKKITKDEFIRVYEKNNIDVQTGQKSVEDYMELYINFKLKVVEALNLGLDTTVAFKQELEKYRQQLAEPYLNDKKVTEKLIKEAYERMKYELRASHILIQVPEYALPEDTLKAFNKIKKIREKAIAGEPFEDLAVQYSDDPSAKGTPASPGNKGDVRYFSAFNMAYPFETMAYNTPVGEISDIVRTSFGYHIIKVVDRIPAMGQINAAHIMIASTQNDDENEAKNAELKINEIHQKLIEGEDFSKLAEQFSDDKGSAARGGSIPPFTANRMIPEIVKELANLDESGQFTKPIKTNFGWHIFKLHDKSGIREFEDMYPEIKARVARDIRSQIGQGVVIERLKDEYDFKQYSENLKPFYEVVDESIFQANWDIKNAEELDKVLFSFAGNDYTQKNFAEYLYNNQVARNPESIHAFIKGRYTAFVNKSIIDYENSVLKEKYPEFKHIYNEYHDGILLFEITDKKVWSKAMNDTTGLEKFYNNNIENYKWDNRINAVIFQFNDEDISSSLRRDIRRAARRGGDYDAILEKYNAKSLLNITASKALYEKHDHPVLKEIEWEEGVSPVIEFDGSYFIINIIEVLEPEYKRLEQIRGLVIADYQSYLEKVWVEYLKDKYNVVINDKALVEVLERYK